MIVNKTISSLICNTKIRRRKIWTKKCKKKPILCRLLEFFRVNSWLIWKNKANFKTDEMSVSIYMKGRYEGKPEIWLKKNKANSKPIKANFIVVNDGFVIPAEAGYVFRRKKPSPKPAALRLPPDTGLLRKRAIWKNKANMPAYGRKSEILSSKS